MRSIKILLPALAIAISCMQGCSSKDFEHCDETLVPTATADAQVVAGGTLNLSVTGINNVHMYNWRGPDKFFSHGENAQVTNVSAVNAGRYTVEVITNDGCMYTATTDSVVITSATPPCTLTNNFAASSNLADISYSSVSGYASGGSYIVHASGTGGSIEMEFAGANRPITGIYEIQSWGGSWVQGSVRVIMWNSGWSWNTGAGKVYVNAANGKLIVSFCNVGFSSNGYNTSINCQVTVP